MTTRSSTKRAKTWTPADIKVDDDEDSSARRATVWRQLIEEPERDLDTLVLICAEYGIDVSKDYVRSTRARWRNTIDVLKQAGHTVPG